MRQGEGGGSTFTGREDKKAINDAANASTGGQYCRLCGAWLGTWGNESTLDGYVANTVEFFRAVKRVLRNDGVLALNLGDSMTSGRSGGGGCGGGAASTLNGGTRQADAVGGHGFDRSAVDFAGLKPGDMCGVPWRVALALQADGWYLRRAIVWAKGLSFCDSYSGSVMPESIGPARWERHRIKVKGATNNSPGGGVGRRNVPGAHASASTPKDAEWIDCPGCDRCRVTGGLVLRRGRWRPTAAYEFIFLLTKSEHYWSNAEAVRECAAMTSPHTQVRLDGGHGPSGPKNADRCAVGQRQDGDGYKADASTRNLRDVWWLPLPDDPEAVWPAGDLFICGPEPLSFEHYAAFPRRLPRTFIDLFVPKKCCPKCGAGWAAVVDTRRTGQSLPLTEGTKNAGLYAHDTSQLGPGVARDTHILGHLPTCACYAGALAAGGDVPAMQAACEKALPPQPGTVLDPCGGSGTTALAAQDAGIHWLLCEASAHYAETIAWPRIRRNSGQGKLPSKPAPAKDMTLFAPSGAEGEAK